MNSTGVPSEPCLRGVSRPRAWRSDYLRHYRKLAKGKAKLGDGVARPIERPAL